MTVHSKKSFHYLLNNQFMRNQKLTKEKQMIKKTNSSLDFNDTLHLKIAYYIISHNYHYCVLKEPKTQKGVHRYMYSLHFMSPAISKKYNSFLYNNQNPKAKKFFLLIQKNNKTENNGNRTHTI